MCSVFAGKSYWINSGFPISSHTWKNKDDADKENHIDRIVIFDYLFTHDFLF